MDYPPSTIVSALIISVLRRQSRTLVQASFENQKPPYVVLALILSELLLESRNPV